MKTKTDLYTKIVLSAIAIILTLNLIKDVDLVSKAQANVPGLSTAIIEKEAAPLQSGWDSPGCYGKTDSRVYYNGIELEGVNARYFKMLKDGYAVDNNRVYYHGQHMKGVSTYKFEVVGGGYAKNGTSVYYQGRELKTAMPKTFVVLCEE